MPRVEAARPNIRGVMNLGREMPIAPMAEANGRKNTGAGRFISPECVRPLRYGRQPPGMGRRQLASRLWRRSANRICLGRGRFISAGNARRQLRGYSGSVLHGIPRFCSPARVPKLHFRHPRCQITEWLISQAGISAQFTGRAAAESGVSVGSSAWRCASHLNHSRRSRAASHVHSFPLCPKSNRIAASPRIDATYQRRTWRALIDNLVGSVRPTS